MSEKRERDNFTDEVARREFEKLPENEQITVLRGIIRYTDMIHMNGEINDDPKYVFWKNNQQLFEGIDITDFMNIQTADEFSCACVYYLCRYINMRAGR